MQIFTSNLNFNVTWTQSAARFLARLSSELCSKFTEKLYGFPSPYLYFQPHLSPWICSWLASHTRVRVWFCGFGQRNIVTHSFMYSDYWSFWLIGRVIKYFKKSILSIHYFFLKTSLEIIFASASDFIRIQKIEVMKNHVRYNSLLL